VIRLYGRAAPRPQPSPAADRAELEAPPRRRTVSRG
jgi:hypothetical protein